MVSVIWTRRSTNLHIKIGNLGNSFNFDITYKYVVTVQIVCILRYLCVKSLARIDAYSF